MNDTSEREMRNKIYNVEDAVTPSTTTNNCSFQQILLTTLNTICHVLVIFVTTYVCCYVGHLPDITNFTNLHVLLCTIGYVLLMSEAIIGLADENIWSRHLNRRSRSHIHWILQVIGAICNISGVVVKYIGAEQRGKRKHFTTNHSLLGIISVGGIIVLALSGIPALFTTKIRKIVRPVVVKFIHNALGITCFVLGMLAVIIAFDKKRYFTKVHKESHSACIVATYVIMIFALLGAIRSLGRQFLGIIK